MSDCNAAFRDRVLLKCFDALERCGFSRFRKENVDFPLSSDFHAWVGLNTGLYDDRVEINPFVGIHVVPIMRLYTSLEGRKYNRAYATYSIHMGEIASNERAFEFRVSTDIDAEAERLARLYEGRGLDYSKSIASYEALLPLLESRLNMLGGYPERMACCLYLMGKSDEARSFAERFLSEEQAYFEGFARPFLKMLDEQMGPPRRAR